MCFSGFEARILTKSYPMPELEPVMRMTRDMMVVPDQLDMGNFWENKAAMVLRNFLIGLRQVLFIKVVEGEIQRSYRLRISSFGSERSDGPQEASPYFLAPYLHPELEYTEGAIANH